MADKCVFYLRVSTDAQARDNLSRGVQLGRCAEYAKRRGYEVYDHGSYVDDDGNPARTGTPAFVDDFSAQTTARPGLLQMLAAAEDRGFQVVICMSVSRATRGDPDLMAEFRLRLKRLGVRMEFADSSSGNERADRMGVVVMSEAAHWESQEKSARTRDGKRASATKRQRHAGGAAPIGYRLVDGKLEVDESQAPVVRGIFAAYLAGASLRGIAADLDAQRTPTARGGTWAFQTVARILSNPVYSGDFVWGTRERVGIGGSIKPVADPSMWVHVPVPPIVSLADFEAAQERLRFAKEAVRRQPKRAYLLTGMVVCSECGRAYTTQYERAGSRGRVTDKVVYRHRRNRNGCLDHNIHGGKLERAVMEWLAARVLDPQRLRADWEEAIARHDKVHGHVDGLLAGIEGRQKKEEAKLARLEDLYLTDGGISKGDYLARRRDILEKVEALDREARELRKQRGKTPPPDFEGFEGFAAAMRRDVGEWLPAGERPAVRRQWDTADLRQHLLALGLRVIIHRGEHPKLALMGGKQRTLSSVTCSSVGQLPVIGTLAGIDT